MKLGSGDVYINATEMAKAFGKRPNDYLNRTSTKGLIAEMTVTRKNGNGENLILTERGGASGGSSWFHEDLAFDYAQWLNIKFRVW